MRLIILSVIYFVGMILLSHKFVPAEYLWTQNTISDLGAQGLRYKWIMQLGFIGFGLLLSAGLVSKSLAARKVVYTDVFLVLWGIAVLLSGFFCAEPYIESVSYSVPEAKLHSLFASSAGVFFSIGILCSLIVSSDPKEKLFHAVFLILVMGTSMMFGLAENGTVSVGKGVIQRLLYAVSFVWLLIDQYWQSVHL